MSITTEAYLKREFGKYFPDYKIEIRFGDMEDIWVQVTNKPGEGSGWLFKHQCGSDDDWFQFTYEGSGPDENDDAGDWYITIPLSEEIEG